MQVNTLFIGQNIIELAETPSTNSFAMQLVAEKGLAEGTVIMAHAQTQGRGQRGNYWESVPGLNFTGSFVLTPRFLLAREQFKLSMTVALSIIHALRILLPQKEIRIKWPNDMYVGDKKIGGILIENTLKGSYLDYAIIGIGLNVNQTFFQSGAPNPTSLKIETGKSFTIAACMELLCNTMEAQYLRLKSTSHEELYTDYTQNLYRFEEWHSYSIEGNTVLGYITGVDATGRLLLKLENGTLKTFDLKEVRFII